MSDTLDKVRPGGGTVEPIEVQPVNRRSGQSLYAPRTKIFPQQAHGRFRTLKWIVMAVTLAIYWGTPWIRWDRGPFAPSQAVLVDLADRRFFFFFIEIWPQEFYFVAGLLIMAGIGLFLVTSTFGRAWCGYTCWQTVWVDLFIAVERLIEGDRNARIKLDKAPWTPRKITLRAAVYATWLVIAVCTGGAWVFYYSDAPTLLHDLVTLQAAPVAYITIGILATTTFVFGGLMREQVCTYMCPWPRIQGAMLDEDSLLVTYNDWRGEPRSRHKKRAAAEQAPVGDCVDCNACVAVCPMGIDIRDGNQLECISCALCIDACDSVMAKLGRQTGLVSYTTLRDYNAQASIAATSGIAAARSTQRYFSWRRVVRPRTLLYAALWSAVGLTMVFALNDRTRLDINVIKDRNPLFVRLADGSIRNGYTLKILNMRQEPRQYEIALDGLAGADLWQAGGREHDTQPIRVDVEADSVKAIRVFVSRRADAGTPSSPSFAFTVRDLGNTETARERAEFSAPGA
ncbi:MAG: cytochrome c oxidase accessory protein CcoG [Bauldia sp.]